MPWTGISGAEQAAGAPACRTEASRDKWRPDAPDGRMRDGTRSRGCRPPDWIIRGQAAARRQGLDHPRRIKQQKPPHPRLESSGDQGRKGALDSNIRGGSGGRSHRTKDSIVEGHVAGRCPGQEQPGQNEKEQPQP